MIFPKPINKGKGNPYRSLLYGSLEEQGIKVGWTRGYLLPFLRAAYRDGMPDLIHLQWQDQIFFGRNLFQTIIRTTQFFVEMFFLRLLGVRFVWTVHNLSNHRGRYLRWERTASRMLAKKADAIVVHCSVIISRVAEYLHVSKEKIHSVHHGHYFGWYGKRIPQNEARQLLDLIPDEKIILYFGSIQNYKGVDRLVKAFRNLRNLQARLLIIGEAESEEIEARIQTLASGDSRIALQFRYLSDSELTQYLAACDVVALPYRDILTSGSAILAATYGRSLIAPAVGCLTEFPEQLLYDPENLSGLEGALRAVGELSRTELNQRGNSAEHYVRQHTWSEAGKHLRQIYQQVCV